MSEGPDFNNIVPRDPYQERTESKEGSDQKEFEGGEEGEEIEPAKTDKKRYKEVEEVSFPSLDDALKMNFDLNNLTNI